MATTVSIPLRGKRLRITQLDSCGRVPEAADEDAFLVTAGFINLNMSFETEDGDEIIQKRADGSLCINEKFADSFKRITLGIEFCEVNPNVLALTTNAEPYSDGEDVIGFTIPEGTIDKYFALEVWTGLAGGGCEPGGDEPSDYWLLPFVAGGVLGDLTLEAANAVTFSLAGAYTKGGNAWGVGPYDVVNSTTPGPLPTALDTDDHALMIHTDLAPPDADDDLQPMPAAA